MDQNDKNLLIELEAGLAYVHNPYAVIGGRIGMSEAEVITRIENLKKMRVIRRFRARINQRRLGIVANALVGWNIGSRDADMVGQQLASMSGVTHCYCRSTCPGKWEYRLYTVHHGWSHEQVLREIDSIAQKSALNDYVVLFSTEEYKRTPHVRLGKREMI
jgi:DNA-binding Lrp family transcriptional regulator